MIIEKAPILDRVGDGKPPVTHLFCECDPNVAACGTDLTDLPFVRETAIPCVVCFALAWHACPLCGLA